MYKNKLLEKVKVYEPLGIAEEMNTNDTNMT